MFVRLNTFSKVRLPTVSVGIMAMALHENGAVGGAKFDGFRSRPPGETDISAMEEIEYQRAFAGLTREDPGFWVRTGLHYGLLAFGAYGLAVLTSSTLRHALETVVSDDLSYSLAHYRPLEREGYYSGFEGDLSEVPTDLFDFTVLRDAGAVSVVFRDFWGGPFPFTRIELPVPRPAGVDLSTTFGCDVLFDREAIRFHWEPEAGLRPLPYGDPVLHAHYSRLWQKRMPHKDPVDELIERITRAVAADGSLRLTLAAVSRHLGYSERTLQRRLRDQGLTFRELVDTALRTKALESLKSSDLQISEIAWQLGYSEAASFNHAFRRWTGLSPAQYRASCESARRQESAALAPTGPLQPV